MNWAVRSSNCCLGRVGEPGRPEQQMTVLRHQNVADNSEASSVHKSPSAVMKLRLNRSESDRRARRYVLVVK